jgi:hypothetical protein
MSYRAPHVIPSRSTISDLFCKKFHVNSLLGILRILGVNLFSEYLGLGSPFYKQVLSITTTYTERFVSDAHSHLLKELKLVFSTENPTPIEAISYAQEFQSKVSIAYHSQKIYTRGVSTVSSRASTSAASKPKRHLCRESR